MKKMKFWIWLITFIPLVAFIYFYNDFQTVIPVAWNEFGEGKEYITKTLSIFIIPITVIFISMVMHFIMKMTKKENPKILKVNYLTIWLLITMMAAFAACFPLYLVYSGGGNQYDVLATSLAVIAGLVFVTGFIFPIFKYESKYGFRTPWTKASKVVYKKTQQIASATFLIGSLILGATTLFVNEYTTPAVLFYILIMLVMIYIPIKYSKNRYENE